MNILWTGSDALFQTCYPPGISRKFRIKIFLERIAIKIIRPFIETHYVDHKLLKYHLLTMGIKNIIVTPDYVFNPEPFDKIKHEGFNILVYVPANKNNPKFIEWLYGLDIYAQLRRELSGINWVIVDGSADMSKIFPTIDFYLRPTRHDGASRLVKECEINKIPTYWSQQNPDINEAKKTIERAINAKR